MAQKKVDSVLIGLLAFIALIIYAVATLISLLGGNLGFLANVGTVCLLLATFLAAWNYVANKADIWKIIYLIILIFTIVMFLVHVFR